MSDPQSTTQYPRPNADQDAASTFVPDCRTTDPSVVATGQSWGEYELIQEIARGGMGVVFKAKQTRLGRTVALKMILDGQLANAEQVRRFHTEAQAAASLQHPHIVAIYGDGEYQGRHYFSMEFVNGEDLAHRVKRGVLPGRDAATLMLKLAGALAYAHGKGVLHRDLKPQNILLDERGEPKLTDFGLAKVVNQASDHANTRSGTVMGTPSYMAPEQASGQTREVGPPTDVYGLGAVLYEMLTGRPPFKGETALDTVMAVLHEEALPPRLLNHKVDLDLEKIVLKCLEKKPELRYPTAEALAADLRAYLDGEPIQARSINLLERLTRELGHSQHDKQMRHWGHGLAIFGAGIILCHLCTSLMLVVGVPEPICFWIPRLVLVVLMGGLLLRFRPQHSVFLPTNAVERTIFALAFGYIAAFGVLFLDLVILNHKHLEVYGPATALGGLVWFALGGQVWGWLYLVGAVFFAASPLMSLMAGSPWSPFVFGCLWGISFLLLGARYSVLAQDGD